MKILTLIDFRKLFKRNYSNFFFFFRHVMLELCYKNYPHFKEINTFKMKLTLVVPELLP